MKRKATNWRRGVVAALAFTGIAFAAAAAGDLDSTFGNAGVVTTTATDGYVRAVATQSTGKVLVGGNDAVGGVGWKVRRYNTDGSLDTTFANNGVFSRFDDRLDTVFDIAVDAQDGIYLLGQAGYAEEVTTGKGKKQTTTTVVRVKSTLLRLDADGALDTEFGDSGVVVLDVPGREFWAGAKSLPQREGPGEPDLDARGRSAEASRVGRRARCRIRR
jgi:uncharacterized delta-60 repeat protein